MQYSPICKLLSAQFVTTENKINLSTPVLTTARYLHVQHGKEVSRNGSSSWEGQFYLPSFLYRSFLQVLLWSQVSSSTILRANLGFIYNFSHSKIDRSTGCQTSFSQERIAFTKPSIDHPPSHTFHVGIPSQPHKEQRSSSPQCFLQKGCALRSSSKHSPYSHLNTENSLLL